MEHCQSLTLRDRYRLNGRIEQSGVTHLALCVWMPRIICYEL
jgi:hypothetical protein